MNDERDREEEVGRSDEEMIGADDEFEDDDAVDDDTDEEDVEE
jgi:hypothetical protein